MPAVAQVREKWQVQDSTVGLGAVRFVEVGEHGMPAVEWGEEWDEDCKRWDSRALLRRFGFVSTQFVWGLDLQVLDFWLLGLRKLEWRRLERRLKLKMVELRRLELRAFGF